MEMYSLLIRTILGLMMMIKRTMTRRMTKVTRLLMGVTLTMRSSYR